MAPVKGRKRTTRTTAQAEKQRQMELFLKDFDVQFKERLASVREAKEKMLERIEHEFQLERMKIPKEIREMKWLDYVACGGDVDVAQLKAGVDFAVPQVPPQTKKKLQPANRAIPVLDATQQVAGSSKASGQTARKKTRMVAETPAAGGKHLDNSRFVTPAAGLMQEARLARMGEVMFSARGSPITVGPRRGGIGRLAPPEHDPVVAMMTDERSPSQMNRSELAELESVPGQHLSKLQDRLKKIIQIKQQKDEAK